MIVAKGKTFCGEHATMVSSLVPPKEEKVTWVFIYTEQMQPNKQLCLSAPTNPVQHVWSPDLRLTVKLFLIKHPVIFYSH